MTPPLVVAALGSRIELDLDGVPGALGRRIERNWAMCRTGPDPGADDVVPVRERIAAVDRITPPVRGRRREDAVTMYLTRAVTARAVSSSAARVLVLHAGALADPVTGATIGYAAIAGGGKTTLTRTLGPGRAYISDEALAIAEDGRIHAYPKPLSPRRPDWDWVRTEVPPQECGLLPPPPQPWLAGLLLLQRIADGPPVLAVTTMERLDGVAALAGHAVGLPRLDRPLQRIANALDRVGGAHRRHLP